MLTFGVIEIGITHKNYRRMVFRAGIGLYNHTVRPGVT